MASYNAINAVPNNINHCLLTDLPKDEWWHEGFVVSVLGGVTTMVQGHGQRNMDSVDAVTKSIAAGCDFSEAESERHIPAAVESSRLSPDRVDDAVRRVLRVPMRLGEFDPFDSVAGSRISSDVVHCRKHRDLAREVARQAIVRLRNQPVARDEAPLEPQDERLGIAAAAMVADAAIVVVGTSDTVEHECLDRRTLTLTGRQDDLAGPCSPPIRGRSSCSRAPARSPCLGWPDTRPRSCRPGGAAATVARLAPRSSAATRAPPAGVRRASAGVAIWKQP